MLRFAVLLSTWLICFGTAQAQTMPAPAPHPQTGEAGTWIPDWLKLQHLQDASTLKQCTADLAGANEQLQWSAGQLVDVKTALLFETKSVDKLEKTLAVVRVDRNVLVTKTQRRSTTMWVFVGTTTVLAGVVVALTTH